MAGYRGRHSTRFASSPHPIARLGAVRARCRYRSACHQPGRSARNPSRYVPGVQDGLETWVSQRVVQKAPSGLAGEDPRGLLRRITPTPEQPQAVETQEYAAYREDDVS